MKLWACSGRMVQDAVKGTPTDVPSRTDQLLLKTRASTPFRVLDSDSMMLNQLHPMSGELKHQTLGNLVP